MKITPAMRRALEAVRDDKCELYFRHEGRTMSGPKGVGGASLWRVFNRGLAKVGSLTANWARLKLTKAGERALAGPAK